MSKISIYGIKNCDTMKKTFKWLEEHHIDYTFHDYKKEDAPLPVIEKAIHQHGWESVINRRGTTWRKLSNDLKDNVDEARALSAALESPSIIKRPLLQTQDAIYLGFDEDIYKEALLA